MTQFKIPLSPEAWCMCCSGTGELEEVQYVGYFTLPHLTTVKTGAVRPCGGCNGTKVSVRAQKWRVESNYDAQQPNT